MYIPKLRKQDNVAKEIKKIDDNTALTGYLVETLVRKGLISKIDYGNAILINLDELAEFFTKTKKNKKWKKNQQEKFIDILKE